MSKKKIFNLCLSAAVLSQTALSGAGTLLVSANTTNWVEDSSLSAGTVQEPKKDTVLPSPYQYEYQQEELAAFCHFGPNTFNEIEWGEHYGNRTPNDIFKLTKDFDADTFVKGVKDAGFTKLIVTAKHHDGFCIWNSKHTEYDMGSVTNYKNGQGDILAEISAACTKYDIDMGLYLSPWDIHDESYGYKDANGNPLVQQNGQPNAGLTWDDVYAQDKKDYNVFYNNTLEEILGNEKYGNKGHFKEIWMDGAKGSGANAQKYDFIKWFDTIQKHEGKAAGFKDDCQLFGAEAYTGVRWIGNEHGFAHDETWSKSKVDIDNNTINSRSEGGYTKGFADGNKWTVPEADARITSGWFWGTTKNTPKSMEALGEMYFRSVGHNAPLLLNIPPNNEGKIDTAIMNRLLEFGNNIKDTFKTNLAVGATIKASQVRGNNSKFSPKNLLDGRDDTYWAVEDSTNSASILLQLPQTTKFDVVSIEEAIQFGQRIGSYKVEYRKNGESTWKTFDEGATIGAKRLCRNQAVEADEVKITVTCHNQAENKTPMLTQVGLFKATKKFEISTGVPEGFKFIDDTKLQKSDGWNNDAASTNFINSTAMWTNGMDKWASATFTGSKAYIVGTVDPAHGVADVYVDDKLVKRIDTNGPSRKLRQVLYETDTLPHGQHTIKIVNKGTENKKAIGIDAFVYLDNAGKGAFQIEYPSYEVCEGKEIPIKIKRIGGTSGAADVDFQVNPGSAWQDHFDANGNMKVHFEDGQSEAFAKVTTKRVPATTGTLSFTAELVNPTNGVLIGYNNPADINIHDTEELSADVLKTAIDQAKAANYTTAEYTDTTVNALQKALANAEAVYRKPNVSKQEIASAWGDLTVAVANMQKRSTYTEKDPFVMPSIKGTTKSLEAEHAILDGSKAASGKHVRVEEDERASNGKKVGWFEPNNKVSVPFYAAKPGTYTMKVTFQSGRDSNNPNELVLSSPAMTEKITRSVHADSSGTSNPGYQTIAFDVVLNGEGPITSEFVFEANAKGSPNLDKVEITAKEVAMSKYTITASSKGEGTLSDTGAVEVTEGSNKTITVTPKEGYTVKDVVVDGVSVGPCLSYVFNNVLENHAIEVEFVKNAIDANNRFVFPAKGNTAYLEAERLELHNTGAANEPWKMGVKDQNWASMGKVVDSMNGTDTMTLYYNAAEPGVYDVTLNYRSGGTENSISWSEASGNVKAGRVVAGHNDPSVTKTKRFTIEVLKAGPGVITFSTGDKNAPIMDNFIITNNNEEVKLETAQLENAIIDATKLDLTIYEDGAAKEAFKQALKEAKAALDAAKAGTLTQEEVNAATAKLAAAQGELRLQEQAPTVNKEALQAAIQLAEKVNLSNYKDGAEKDAFKTALANAKVVLANANASEEEVAKATSALNVAKDKLVPNETPGNPGTGEKPTPNPDKPGNPGSGDSTTPGKPNTGDGTTINPVDPKPENKPNKDETGTGDVTSMSMFASMLAASGAAVTAILKRRNKK